MKIDVFIIGGGSARLELQAADLEEVAAQLWRERGLVGSLIAMNGDEAVSGRVYVPAQKVALIREDY